MYHSGHLTGVPSLISTELTIRPARPDEAPLLTAIAHAAKRHWRYPEAWMAQWRDALTITPGTIATHDVYVTVGNGEVHGFYALSVHGLTGVLEHLWIRPQAIGRGVGRSLLAHAVERATAAGAAELVIDSDPNAEGFYLRMGARRVGEIPADVGGTSRTLPRLVLTLRPLPGTPGATVARS